MALAYVLWIVALLTLLLGGLETAAGNQLLLARNLVDQARAEALAEGAIELVMADIARLPPDGVRLGTRTLRLPTGDVRVTVTDLGGLIDINTAHPALLERIMRAIGAPPDLAADLAARIAERRTTTAPVLLLDELQQLPGVTFALYQQLAPLLTAQGGHPIADPGVAPPAVLLALADLDEDAVQRHLALRTETGRFAPSGFADAGPIIGAGFELRAEVASGGGGRAVRVAVVKPARPGEAEPGLRLVDWRSEPAG
jgi:general secretion pathway protein K